jgi:hypothetical protein
MIMNCYEGEAPNVLLNGFSAGVCGAAADQRPVRLMLVSISRIPTQCSCKT